MIDFMHQMYVAFPLFLNIEFEAQLLIQTTIDGH